MTMKGTEAEDSDQAGRSGRKTGKALGGCPGGNENRGQKIMSHVYLSVFLLDI